MPADYIMQAQKDGCSILGFSDHCPYSATMNDYWPEIRMSVAQVPEYITAVREAARNAPFPVYCGFECEWDAAYRNWYGDTLLGEYGAQYLVLGSHWLTEGKRHIYVQDIRSASDLHKYIDQTVQAMQTGLYAYLAHPDLFMGGWKEWDAEAQSCLQSLLRAAADCAMPVEVNGYGMVKTPVMTTRGERFQYPVEEFWKMAAASDVRVICNSDAHHPADVIKNAELARSFAEKLGIQPVETIF